MRPATAALLLNLSIAGSERLERPRAPEEGNAGGSSYGKHQGEKEEDEDGPYDNWHGAEFEGLRERTADERKHTPPIDGVHPIHDQSCGLIGPIARQLVANQRPSTVVATLRIVAFELAIRIRDVRLA
eukprot:scaffold50547_cov33-Tisochrysis_lutea.AAC.5